MNDFERIMEGLAEAVAFARGEDVPGIRVHIPAEIDTKAIRRDLGGLTQATFAARYGFSLGAVRDWEQGRSVPDLSTRAFLKVIAAEPAVVERVLEARIASLDKEGQRAMRTIQRGGHSAATMAAVIEKEAAREAAKKARKVGLSNPSERSRRRYAKPPA